MMRRMMDGEDKNRQGVKIKIGLGRIWLQAKVELFSIHIILLYDSLLRCSLHQVELIVYIQ